MLQGSTRAGMTSGAEVSWSATANLRYSGSRAWMKYIGVKIPSRPASAMTSAHRSRVSATRTEPCGAMWSVSIALSELRVTQRPILELRKEAKERPSPTRGWYQGTEGPVCTARSRVSRTSNPTDRNALSMVAPGSWRSRLLWPFAQATGRPRGRFSKSITLKSRYLRPPTRTTISSATHSGPVRIFVSQTMPRARSAKSCTHRMMVGGVGLAAEVFCGGVPQKTLRCRNPAGESSVPWSR